MSLCDPVVTSPYTSRATSIDFMESDRGWFEAWPQIQNRIISRPKILLCMGFDGILSPTTDRASQVRLPEEIRSLLVKLHASPRLVLGFLSGRSIGDLQERIGLPNAFYGGNHGMEVLGKGLRCWDGLASSCRADLVDTLAFLFRFARKLPGVQIEDKGLSLTVHWRMASPADRASLKELVTHIDKSYPRLHISEGDACWDIRGRASWNKGNAICRILDHLGLTAADTFYIGNEPTDEGTFAQLSEGLTFCMGESAGGAHFCIRTEGELTQLLFSISCVTSNELSIEQADKRSLRKCNAIE